MFGAFALIGGCGAADSAEVVTTLRTMLRPSLVLILRHALGLDHGALLAVAMASPCDTTMVTKAEVLKLAGGGGARVDR
jgi:hypothetical protein